MRRADREGWVAISKDNAIPRDPADTLDATTLRLFLIPTANIPGTEIVRRLMANWEAILRQSETSGPYAYVVMPNRLKRRWP